MKKIIGLICLCFSLVSFSEVEAKIIISDEPGIIFGRVFIDRNENGVFDDEEEGVRGAKIITSQGEVVTTDVNGQYNYEIYRQNTGNFMVKIDKKSIPTLYKLSGNNSEVVRLSPGMPIKVNFAVIYKDKAKRKQEKEKAKALEPDRIS